MKRTAARTALPITLTTVSVTALVLLSSACGGSSAKIARASQFTYDDQHRLYAAALAASDSPLDSEIFKRVCLQIDVFDASGKANDKYMQFVSAHVDWATHRQTEQFRNEINTPEKARQYIDQHLAE